MLQKRLAVGGMAELFLAKDGTTGGEVVIKRILPYLSHEPEFVQMFLDEARIAAQLHHPNIIQVHELGKLQDSMFIAMEFVDGIDLRKLFQEESKLGFTIPYGVAALVTARVCQGLYYAHNATGVDGRKLGVIHRDVSPQNVMVGFDGRVKLVDFGISKATAVMERSKPGVIKGKFLYLSPEQLSQERIDHRADLFAMGSMLYELTTGKSPFYKPSTEAVIYAVRAEEPQSPTALKSDYPPELARIVMKCLVKDRNRRYQQADEIAHDLEVFLATTLPTGEDELREYIDRLFGTDEDATRMAVEGQKPAPLKPISKPPSGASPSASPSEEPVRASPGLIRKPTITGGRQMADPGSGIATKMASPGEVARAMVTTPAPPQRKASGARYQSAGMGAPEPSVTHETLPDRFRPALPPVEDDDPELTLPPNLAQQAELPRYAPVDDGDEDESTLPLQAAARAPRQGSLPPPPMNRLGVDPAEFGALDPLGDNLASPPVPSEPSLTPMTDGPFRDEDGGELATLFDKPRSAPSRLKSAPSRVSAPGKAAPRTTDPANPGRLLVVAMGGLLVVAVGIILWLVLAQAPAMATPDPPAGEDGVETVQLDDRRKEAAAESAAEEETKPARPEPEAPEPAPAEAVSPVAEKAEAPTEVPLQRIRKPLSTRKLTLVFDGPRGATVLRNGDAIPLGVAVEADPGLIEYEYRCPGKRATLKGAIEMDASAVGTPVHIPLSNCRL